MAQVKVARDELEAARRMVEQASEGLDIEKQAIYLFAPVLLAEAQLQLALSQPGDAVARLEYLIGRLRRAEVRSYLPETLWLQGKALLALEQAEQARQSFLEGQKVAAETGARRMGWPILWELSQLEAAAGNTDAAQQYRQQAQEIVTYISDHTGSNELRASFLALPEVQALGGR